MNDPPLLEMYNHIAEQGGWNAWLTHPRRLGWIGWPWLVCGTVTVLLLCCAVNCVVLDLNHRQRMIERAEGITRVGGWQ